jgi:hypothetical protein
MTRVVLISMRSHDRERSPAPHDDDDKQIPGWAKIARTKDEPRRGLLQLVFEPSQAALGSPNASGSMGG